MEDIKVQILTKPDQFPQFVNAIALSFSPHGCYLDFGFIDPVRMDSRIESMEEEKIINAELVSRFVMSFNTAKEFSDLLSTSLAKIDFDESVLASEEDKNG